MDSKRNKKSFILLLYYIISLLKIRNILDIGYNVHIDLNVNFGYGGVADLRDDDTMCCRQFLVIPHSTVEYTDLCLRE